jgi:hypothetical protein
MMQVPEKIKTLSHPSIASAYLKRDFSDPAHAQDVLVLETNFEAEDGEFESFDEYVIGILTDLNDLRDQVEKEIGRFDRIDIRH